jgi:hypothetical protein
VRARAQALVTLELGPETELERTAKLLNEVEQERFTHINRMFLGRSKDGIVVVGSTDREHPIQQTMRIGRLKKLEGLGLAEERRTGVWSIGPELEPKLRQLGERADIFKMVQRALKEAGIERPAPGLAVFESGRRRTPLVSKAVAVGLIDEITDRHYVVVDGIDGRVHYAPLGRLPAAQLPGRGMIVSLSGDSLHGEPNSLPCLRSYPPSRSRTRSTTMAQRGWIGRNFTRERLHVSPAGFGAELNQALTSAAAGSPSRGSPRPVLAVR